MGIIGTEHGQRGPTAAERARISPRVSQGSNRSITGKVVASAAAIALLLGCSGSEGGRPELSDLNSQRMLQVGLTDIQQIYIDEPSVSDLAVAGLKGLQRIEPDFNVERQADIVRISLREASAGFVKAPQSDDAQGWATTVSQILNDGRKLSGRLGQARAEEIYTALFESVASKLDPYSRYSGAGEARESRASRDGFGGIGVTIIPHLEGVEVTEVAASLPAERSGVKRGDLILSIDGEKVAGLDLQAAALLLQGPVGEPVKLTVRGKDKAYPATVLVDRTHITPQTVFFRKEGSFALIEITSFNAETAASIAQAVYRARHDMGEALRGIILDLRNNPGGLLHQSVRVADLFIESGRIISTRGRHRDSLQIFDATPGDISNGLPIAVLLNGYSASAAEILAAALQDRGRAVIIGSTSYGKGTVQTVLRMPNDGELILTWARLHAPSGYSMHGLGVVPTICTAGRNRSVDALVRAALANDAPWKRMLAIRRNYAAVSAEERTQIEGYCPAAQKTEEGVDLEVAKSLLSVQKGYMQTIQIARTPNGF
jgi:carboxyl-terminal processing protease